MPEITMPRLSDTMSEGTITSWRKQVGDQIVAGDVLLEVETDKAIMELEAYDEGLLERILVGEGESAPIGALIGMIGDGSGAAQQEAAPAAEANAPEAAFAAPLAAEAPSPAITPADESTLSGHGRPLASPLARRHARERGVDLRTVRGTGPQGRIIRTDIEAATRAGVATVEADVPVAPVADAPAEAADRSDVPDVVDVPLSAMQRVAAARLTKSKQEAPHFYLTSAVDVTDLIAFRSTLNTTLVQAGGAKVSVNDLVVKAVATALSAHPEVNVSFAGDLLRRHLRVHVGVAVAVPSGLLVPIVRDADRKGVSEIAAEIREMSGRARESRLRPDEMTGGTFTVSNLGMYGVEQFAAVINPPEAVILAVGAATEELRPRDGAPVVRSILRITLSCDHRAVDGATGALFLQTLTSLLENPLRILV